MPRFLRVAVPTFFVVFLGLVGSPVQANAVPGDLPAPAVYFGWFTSPPPCDPAIGECMDYVFVVRGTFLGDTLNITPLFSCHNCTSGSVVSGSIILTSGTAILFNATFNDGGEFYSSAGGCLGNIFQLCDSLSDTITVTDFNGTTVRYEGKFTYSSYFEGYLGGTPEERSYLAATAEPEPASFILFGSGLLALGVVFRRRLGFEGSRHV